VNRWWMDFGGSFEAVFRRICRFILVVWAKKGAYTGPKRHPKGAVNSIHYTLLALEHRWPRTAAEARGVLDTIT
jgi:hypothetical protein